jgi:LEA14-like dessication related protein
MARYLGNATMRRGVTALTLILLLIAWGCGPPRLLREKLDPPKVSLRGVGLMKPSTQGLPLLVLLEVHNPNPLEITLLGYDYEVWLEGRSMAKGASSERVTLPARGEALVEVPVMLNLAALPALLPRLLNREKFSYEVAGGFRLPETLGFRVPFRFRGETTPKEGLERLRR